VNLSALPSVDRDSALKNAVTVLKSKKPRLSDEDAVQLAHDILTASAPFISAGTIQYVAETEKDYAIRSHLANRASVHRESASQVLKEAPTI